MRGIFFLYCLMAGVMWGVNGANHCDHLGTLLYDDLDCKPLRETGSPCPYRYTCDLSPPQNQSCILRGKSYNIGDKIEESLLTENCLFDCKCVNPTGLERYECGVMNCTDWTENYNSTVCYKTYDVDNCCTTGMKCPNEENDIHECLFEGVRYLEGQLFIPSNSCTKCSCQKGFRGIVEEPYCKRNMCGTQIVNFEELENFCAPLYLPSSGDTALCCPHDWVCYSENDNITTISHAIDPGLGLVCNFGPIEVGFGEGFKRLFNYFGRDLQVTCECKLPPLLTCKKT